MKKSLSLVVAGIFLALTAGVVHQSASKAPVIDNQAEVVLGHRIGPAGQEMLVYGH